ncbi:MAG: beta/gamma crystallin domain-containing protein [Pyrinomonadaceae bacterium]
MIKLNLPKDAVTADPPSSDCWVTFYESQDYRDKSVTLYGPVEYRNLKNLPGGGGIDWGDQFDSLRTGPNAWVTIYNDENFEDDRYTYGPGSSQRQLPSGDDVDSLRIYDRNPNA